MDDVLRFDVVTESSVIDADLNLSKLFRTKVPGHHIFILCIVLYYFNDNEIFLTSL